MGTTLHSSISTTRSTSRGFHICSHQ